MDPVKVARILAAARPVFLRYGFRRVTMNDLAEAAGISRPALYLLFKNKEQIFNEVYRHWIDETIEAVASAMAAATTPVEKIERAFEVWVIRPFEMAKFSVEAQELIDCSFGFAKAAQQEGYAKFELKIAPVLASFIAGSPTQNRLTASRMAHVLASAMRGFKITATTSDELRLLIDDLLTLSLKSGNL